MYIGDYLGRREIYSPEATAFVDTGKVPPLRLTFAAANERANRLASYLRGQGLGKGDRAAILARDGVEHMDLLFACGKLGAIHTPYNWRLHWRELKDLLGRTRPKVLFYGREFRQQVEDILRALAGEGGQVPTLVHLEGEGLPGSVAYPEALAKGSPEPVTCEGLDKEDIAALVFTGGTTGTPKAAQISHRMIAWNTLNTIIHDLRHGDIYLNVFPLFHTGGLFVYTLPLVILGGTTLFMRQFEPEQVLELIERERVTVFAGVPSMYQMLTQAPNWERADLSSLRFCTSGGAPLPVPLVRQYAREKGVRFKQGFGMTEFGPGVFALAAEDAERKAGSIGRPNFFVEARIVDEQGAFLGPDRVGELVLKGPSLCSGYFEDPQASQEAVDALGFFHTGDLARYDAQGYFYIVDRKKDMFISGGENIYPAEIEKALYEHPAVHMCAVVGVPDEKWGEVGHAFVVLRPGARASQEELLGFLEKRLARFKIPKGVTFVESLPLSAAGKVLKRELRARWKR
jgi:fatty-acyl-CoA synthase